MNIKPCISFVVLALLTACNQDPPPNPVAQNTLDNAVTKRQKIVEHFRSAEVTQLPYSQIEFIVRDTNGAVWYVNTDTKSSSTPSGGTMLLFAGRTTDWTPPALYRPTDDMLLASNLVVGLVQAYLQVSQTNTATTNKVLVEDPEPKK